MPDFAGPVGFKEWEERGVSVCDSVSVRGRVRVTV